MKHKTFTFRSSWFEAMRNMSDASRLALMDAICRHAVTPQAAHPDRHSILNGRTPGYNA